MDFAELVQAPGSRRRPRATRPSSRAPTSGHRRDVVVTATSPELCGAGSNCPPCSCIRRSQAAPGLSDTWLATMSNALGDCPPRPTRHPDHHQTLVAKTPSHDTRSTARPIVRSSLDPRDSGSSTTPRGCRSRRHAADLGLDQPRQKRPSHARLSVISRADRRRTLSAARWVDTRGRPSGQLLRSAHTQALCEAIDRSLSPRG